MNPKPLASLNHLTVPVAISNFPCNSCHYHEPSKSHDYTRQSLPPHKLTIGIFSKLLLGEKSASLIVEALYSSVKEILRRRCRVANTLLFQGFYRFRYVRLRKRQALKSRIIVSPADSARGAGAQRRERCQPAPAGCAILDPTALQHLARSRTG
ncbi:hypothetical protein [Paraburkholderia sejongensis]|uniref:hypothetical protein n=1 Tax=Paraburkholderia sejongensis TaxID=2886946 RepID=UPI001E55F75F|nr:hypothetical protein [Paraburkholderia sp. MMS20-SJTR3]